MRVTEADPGMRAGWGKGWFLLLAPAATKVEWRFIALNPFRLSVAWQRRGSQRDQALGSGVLKCRRQA